MPVFQTFDLSQGHWSLSRARLRHALLLEFSLLDLYMPLRRLVCLSVLFGCSVLASMPTTAADDMPVTNEVTNEEANEEANEGSNVGLHADMVQIGEQLLLILPSLHAESVDREVLRQNMLRLEQLLDQAQPHLQQAPGDYSSTYQQPYDMLRESLAQAVEMTGVANLKFVKSSLTQTFELCAACHTQDKQSRRILGISKIKSLDELLAAEYSYLTRDYDSALVSFANVLDDKNSTSNDRSKALDRILIIEVEVKADLDAGIQQLELLRGLGKGNDTELAQLGDWIEVLRQVQLAPKAASPLHKKSILDLDAFLRLRWPTIQANLTWHGQTAYWMVIRGELNRLLRSTTDAAEMPRLYYWLAVSDRSLNYQFFDSLSRRYLEQCIEQYPAHAYGQKRQQEYETLVTTSFSGSAGTFVPVQIRQRLDTMRNRVKGVKP